MKQSDITRYYELILYLYSNLPVSKKKRIKKEKRNKSPVSVYKRKFQKSLKIL